MVSFETLTQLVTPWIQAVATLVLVIITIIYAIGTMRMARVMEQDYRCRYTPSIDVEPSIQQLSPITRWSTSVGITNRGYSPTKILSACIKEGDRVVTEKKDFMLWPPKPCHLSHDFYMTAVTETGVFVEVIYEGFEGRREVIKKKVFPPN